ncbi:unnamed protein product [Cylindrotheca closterium]|uniref:PiggyBac transposable element-derived protein domain-containing protein n=1 Tax=Cylindrotheca closterium TaxID=2856 RepID=A0AAD2CQ58_9STRA|nr:unnamed protein product [Cylindrotheca closterium]
MIVYNPSKPTGKYHFRFYCLCEADHYNCIRLIVHTKSGCDKADGFVDPTVEETGSDFEEMYSSDSENDSDSDTGLFQDTAWTKSLTKTSQLVLDICDVLDGSGKVVNMDNYYTSPQVLIALKKKNIYARGTCRKNRKMYPQAVTFNNQECKDLPRGSAKIATNQKHSLVAFGWTDGNPVHFITSADGNEMGSVKRLVGSKRNTFPAPAAIQRYNHGMQAVDRFDQWVSLFSLAQRHHFKKWYKKMAMALFDFGLTNAELHYFMVHPRERKEKCHRYDFRDLLCQQLEDTEWRMYESASQEEIMHKLGGAFDTADSADADATNLVAGTITCKFIPSGSQPTTRGGKGKSKISQKGKSCHVCNWERQYQKAKHVFFGQSHYVRACMEIPSIDYTKVPAEASKRRDEIQKSEPEELDWLCPNRNLTCWEKAHQFYIPKGLWGEDHSRTSHRKNARIALATSRKCQLYHSKDAWMVSHGFKSRRAVPTGGYRPAGNRQQNSSNPDEQPMTLGQSVGQVEHL